MKEIMIVAGEASGDMHGAKLVSAMRTIDPDLKFTGVGSNELRSKGVEIIFEASRISVVGLFEVFFHLHDIRMALRTLTAKMKEIKPKLLILIDFPDFNLILAKKAKKLGVPVFYYISPQVWAWRSGRVKKISKLVNQLAVILPFEKDFYINRGMEHVEFVGHPLVDSVSSSISKKEFRDQHNILDDTVVVGILPGSRKKEIHSILHHFINTAHLISNKQKVLFVLILAPTVHKEDLTIVQDAVKELQLIVTSSSRYDVMSSCDLVMAASGTVTLELAILNVPMVVAYRISPLTYFLGRRLIKVKYASLVNLVAGREVVTELLQEDFTPENLCDALIEIWPKSEKNLQMRQDLEKVSALLGTKGASANAARLALKVVKDCGEKYENINC